VIPLSLAACGSDTDTSATGGTCYDYSSFNGMSPAVSFQADVLPIFRNSCGLSPSCHGSQSAPPGQPFLGPALSAGMASQGDIDAIFAKIYDPSVKEPTMKNVAPNEPENSFLMHKMDNTLKCESLKCGDNCGVSMPQAAPILAQAQRDTVRRWIAQGAKKD
jgi:hypothetical protein